MAGYHKKSRDSSRNDFHNAQVRDPSSRNRPQPPRPFGLISQNGPRRRSNAQAHSQNSGSHRSNDNSNPNLNARVRNLKQQSDMVRRSLEYLIGQIDELQPHSEAMDWSGSAGTVVYVPVACAADGSFQQPQMRSTNSGDWPNTPIAFAPYTKTIHARMAYSSTHPKVTRSSTMVQGEGSVPGRHTAIAEYGRTDASTARDNTGRQARVDVIGCGPAMRSQQILASLQQGEFGKSNRENVSAYTAPDMSSQGGMSSPGGQRTNLANQPQATVSNVLTPPSSPPERYGKARYEDLRM